MRVVPAVSPALHRVSQALTLTIGVLLASALAAQSPVNTGAISGTVVDPLGVAAPNIAVQVRSGASGETPRRATSDAAGRYTVGDLPPGTYDVTASSPGLKGFERKGVQVQSTTAVIDIRFEEGTQLSTLGEDAAGAAADRLRHKPPAGPTPRTIDGKPDLSGIWWSPATTEPGKPEWLPAALRVAAERQANNRMDSPQVRCLPSGVLRRGPVIEFVQSKALLIEISDDDSPGFHQIYLEGHQHPKEPDMLWYGDSVGKWDGDTLVVDRVNFIEDVWLDAEGHPHGDQLHVVERYRRPDLGHLEAEITVEDPTILAHPWTFKRVSELAPTEEIREFMCNENNMDLAHLVGK